jgi:hypothetical protein
MASRWVLRRPDAHIVFRLNSSWRGEQFLLADTLRLE